MITTGWPYSNGAHTEVLDLLNPTSNCAPGLEFPVEIQGATGGIVDETPIICGGWNGLTRIKECFKLVDNNWQPAGMLETGQSDMGTGNVVIEKQLLLSGGYDGSRLYQTSLLDTTSTLKLKDMPNGISDHCMVKLDQSKIMLIGGFDDENGRRSETLIFDVENQQWSDGPRMRILGRIG